MRLLRGFRFRVACGRTLGDGVRARGFRGGVRRDRVKDLQGRRIAVVVFMGEALVALWGWRWVKEGGEVVKGREAGGWP